MGNRIIYKMKYRYIYKNYTIVKTIGAILSNIQVSYKTPLKTTNSDKIQYKET